MSTEWDDIQRRIGNLPELPTPEPSAPWPDQPPAPPPAPDDDEELARLRAARLDEIKRERSGPRFGSVAPLAHADYVAEVNGAGEGVGVVVFLHRPRHYDSAFMLVLLEKLARKFGDVKFLQIDANECIPGYPDRNVPTLLIYKDDELLGQTVGTAPFGGPSYDVDDLEWELAQAGVLETLLERNPHEGRGQAAAASGAAPAPA